MQPIIRTYTGKSICPLNIKPEDIELEDIARGLSNICRFGGQVEKFYSVAQHSVLCAELAIKLKYSKNQTLSCLTHDISEAYLGDIIAPIKGNFAISTLPDGKITSVHEVEDRIINAMSQRYNLNLDCNNPKIKYVDKILLNSESYYLRGIKVYDTLPVISKPIIPLTPKESYLQFLDMCAKLGLTRSDHSTSYNSNIEPSSVDPVMRNYGERETTFYAQDHPF